MRARAFLDSVRALPLETVEGLTEGQPFVVLSPHPDDESLGVGGLIAAACAAGQTVEVVVITDGSGSHTKSTQVPRDALVALRERETRRAGLALGLPDDRLTFLGLMDAKAPNNGPEFDAAVAQIADVVSRVGARTVFVTWKHDPHCDHEAAARMAVALREQHPALRLWFYPIWGWHLDPDSVIDAPAPRGCRIDISGWRQAKTDAINAHASQMTDLIADDPEGFRFTPETIAPFQGHYEYFVEVPE